MTVNAATWRRPVLYRPALMRDGWSAVTTCGDGGGEETCKAKEQMAKRWTKDAALDAAARDRRLVSIALQHLTDGLPAPHARTSAAGLTAAGRVWHRGE